MGNSQHKSALDSLQPVAGNGLLDRRALLGKGIFLAGAAATGAGSITAAAAEPLKDDPWSRVMGSITLPRQEPSP
jgi:sulfane dehydrogenase subunit SoxC